MPVTVLDVGYSSEQAKVLPSWSLYSTREKQRYVPGIKCFEEKVTKPLGKELAKEGKALNVSCWRNCKSEAV